MKKSGKQGNFATQVLLHVGLFVVSGCFGYLAELLWQVRVVSFVAGALACIAFFVAYNMTAERRYWPLLDPSALWMGFW